MVLSKKINSLLLAILFISCNNPDRDCKDYHTGNFFSETTVNGKIYKSIFLRKDNGIQIEEFEGKVDSSSVRWVNDCEMILSPVNPKSLTEKKNILIKNYPIIRSMSIIPRLKPMSVQKNAFLSKLIFLLI